jgi:hypothetical protein
LAESCDDLAADSDLPRRDGGHLAERGGPRNGVESSLCLGTDRIRLLEIPRSLRGCSRPRRGRRSRRRAIIAAACRDSQSRSCDGPGQVHTHEPNLLPPGSTPQARRRGSPARAPPPPARGDRRPITVPWS